MFASLCIHGHFYQPPREDPWLGNILPEASAAPLGDWNERILRESYAPLAWARRLDASGRICDMLNAYEWISFNVGPTLLSWMRRHAPGVVERMREGDAKSLARWGHGNALAQIYHHVIMPLATPEDREVETRWAVEDFRSLFGRDPEGIWLSEAAVDLQSLETLAAQGIRFVILAPRQARAVTANGVTTPVTEDSLFIGEPYRIALPSGASISAVFYNGGLSRSIAFESLLRDGEIFWHRLTGAAAAMAADHPDPLLSLATDGETYGHHFKFGEMALAHVLAQALAQRDGLRLTNLAAYIAAHPPTREAILHEPSSWSCAHGVERWQSDCGCTDGGHPGWNQKWRAPLRRALDHVRDAVETHFAAAGAACFSHPRQTLLAYGQVLADPETRDSFAATWFRKSAHQEDEILQDRAWKLLAAQEHSLAAFASCAWFFDDLARIEPENALTRALRAMELLVETGGPDIREDVLRLLDPARSNQAGKGSGREVFLADILPRQGNAATMCLLACLLLWSRKRWPAPGVPATWSWPRVSVTLTPENASPEPLRGTAVIRSTFEGRGLSYAWELTLPSPVLEEETAFLNLSRAAITVRAPSGREQRRLVADFSKPMRDYLQGEFLVNREQRLRPRLRAQARHLLALIEPWPEEQHDVLHSFLLAPFAPYLALECALDADPAPDKRAQAQTLLSRHLSPDGALLAARLLAEELQVRLNAALASSPGAPSDDSLASLVHRAKALVPLDVWDLQNRLWEAGTQRFPFLAAALDFS